MISEQSSMVARSLPFCSIRPGSLVHPEQNALTRHETCTIDCDDPEHGCGAPSHTPAFTIRQLWLA